MTGSPTEPEEGTCDLCGQYMIRTPDDCWHPYNVERACPPEPPGLDHAAWSEWYREGNRPLRPGRQHFVPAGA